MGLTRKQAEALNLGHLFPAWSQSSEIEKSMAFPRKNKYKAVRTSYNGVSYDSKMEAEHAMGLDRRKTRGEIKTWIRQVTFPLGDPDTVIRVDFLVFNLDGSTHVEEVKGAWTRKWIQDVKRWRRYGPCEMRVIGARGKVDVIPGRPDWAGSPLAAPPDDPGQPGG